MKLALYDEYVPGVVADGKIADASNAVGAIMSFPPRHRMPAIIEAFDALRPALEALDPSTGTSLEAVQLRAPIPRPPKILCAMRNFREGSDLPLAPLDMFLKAPTTVLDPGGTIVLPPTEASVFHHEAELGLVVGRDAARVSSKDAMSYVFGYTCFIDASARGVGSGVSLRDKSPDTFGPMGPWIVTADEIPDPQSLNVKLWVDGEIHQDYSLTDMACTIADLVSWASNAVTLEPGDLLSCGTNHQGLGAIQDGELVEIEIGGIGRVGVHVRDPLGRKWKTGVDHELAKKVRERLV